MSFCHECGEKVAEIDIYCPFCGISLQPVQVGEAVADDPQSRTIAISQSESAEQLPQAEPGEEPVTPRTEPEEPAFQEVFEQTAEEDSGPVESAVAPDSEPDRKTFDYSDSVTEENVNLQTQTDEDDPASVVTEPDFEVNSGDDWDQPADPVFLRPTGSEPEQEEPASVRSEPEPPVEPAQPESVTVVEARIDTFPENDPTGIRTDPEPEVSGFVESEPAHQTAPEPKPENPDDVITLRTGTDMSLEEPDNPEPSEAETIRAAPEMPAAPVPDESAGEPDRPAATAEEIPVQELPAEPESPAVEISSAEPPEPTSASVAETPEPENIGPSISKPETGLEMEDSLPGVSEFDSVRIIESSAERFENSFEEPESAPPPDSQFERSEPLPESMQRETEPPVEPLEEKEARPYTVQNIGGADTDGKKSKLKPLDEGTVLNGRYEIVRKIGGGGMGAVYLASDKNLGGVLRAVKEMVQSYIEESQQEKAINDFKRESLLLTTLEHPAIPTIYDYFYDEKEARFYLVMKYINGGDLSSRLRSAPENRIDEKSVVDWGAQIADVLDYLHQRQPPIVYRDLKPANLMIDGNTGRVMLIDFGIARWINKEEKGVTAVGTMGYAPPELFSGNVEPRSDIYSLGSTMFHLLTGADPQSNPLLIFDFQKNPRPRQINPQISDQIERILMQAVEYNAEKRIASAAEMRRQLEEHLENLKANRVTYGVRETPQPVALSDENVFCGFCGQSIVASDLFCAFCGAQQPIGQKGVHSENYTSKRHTAKLMILGTNELESPTFNIEKDENLVGRRDPMSNIFPEVDLSKFDPQTKISRRHARIWRDGNNYMIEDLGSSNGTVLIPAVVSESFRLIPNQPQMLTNGDKVKLGDTTLHFILG